MKKHLLLMLSALLFCMVSLTQLYAQISCNNQKVFTEDQTVYYDDGSGNWQKMTYKRPDRNGMHELWKDNDPFNKVLGAAKDIVGPYDYERLDLSKGACSTCTDDHIAYFKRENLRLLNEFREQNGLQALKSNEILDKAAQDYIAWAASNHDVFWPKFYSNAHAADGTQPIDRVKKAASSTGSGNPFESVAQNLTVGALCPDVALESWEKSPSDRSNMLSDRFAHIGIGVACGLLPDGSAFIVAAQVFGPEIPASFYAPPPTSSTQSGSGSSISGYGQFASGTVTGLNRTGDPNFTTMNVMLGSDIVPSNFTGQPSFMLTQLDNSQAYMTYTAKDSKWQTALEGLGNQTITPVEGSNGIKAGDAFTVSYEPGRMVWRFTRSDQQVASFYCKVAIIVESNSKPNPAVFNEMTTGGSLRSNHRIYAPDGQHYLVLTGDGNVMIYASNDQPLWATDTFGSGSGCHLDMQPDGNLVLYDRNNQMLWNSGTHASRDPKYGQSDWQPVKMVFESGGAITLYSKTNRVVWSSAFSKGERP